MFSLIMQTSPKFKQYSHSTSVFGLDCEKENLDKLNLNNKKHKTKKAVDRMQGPCPYADQPIIQTVFILYFSVCIGL